MFERFNPEAKRVLPRAAGEARSLGHAGVDGLHILLGLMAESDLVVDTLAALGISQREIRDRAAMTARRARRLPERLPFTESVKPIVQHSLRESLLAGAGYVGPEHMLLAVICEGGSGARILVELGADLERTQQVLRPALGEPYFKHGTGGSAFEGSCIPAAKLALVLARQTALRLGRARVATEDVLFGIVHVPQSMGPQALVSLGVSLPSVRERLLKSAVRGDESGIAIPEVSSYFLADAMLEAFVDDGRRQVGTEHQLLAILREGAVCAQMLMLDFGVDRSQLREAVGRLRGQVVEPDVPAQIAVPLDLAAWGGAAEKGFAPPEAAP